ncbi:MAG: riboflavin synthase [Candidatus Electryonea clarkiae]|nr:riboflavin synthase [Candidatus Electryonea clarkiae]MDP8285374.1 riboflavin synthase [Candidatus Electryonea clarkiae]
MFTGLVEEIGKIRTIRKSGNGATLIIDAVTVMEGLAIGDSVSISGACQTVVDGSGNSFTVEAVRETMERTKFRDWNRGDQVNLERAMRPVDRLGGHLVQGHVDGLVKVFEIKKLQGSYRIILELPENGKPFIVEKGSVALDGVSLTVASRTENKFEVEVIPHTMENTTFKHLRSGDKVHVEWDIIAKYVHNMLGAYKNQDSLSPEKLMEFGFG